ncbi:MAG: endonuclease/exonuclease/phosphatase family protein [Leptolyngbyaceae cyanobacterium]
MIDSIRINEIRVNQSGPDTDEFFELLGEPGTALDDLTYLVIGDGDGDVAGVVEAIINLNGQVISPDGTFAAGEESAADTGALDLVGPEGLLNFENDDIVTHLVVSGFTGSLDQDLDTNNDGVLDAEPWTAVIDSVGLVTPEVLGPDVGQIYSDIVAGPDGNFLPGGVFRVPDGEGDFEVADFTFGIDDTPGVPNTTPLVINEIRIDQPGSDEGEFFELGGVPGTSLEGLTYLVLGDSEEGGSGVVEAIISLDGQLIQDDGLFAAGEATNPFIGSLDLVGPFGSPGGLLNFENSDNVTHLLVSSFTGTDGQDLDMDDDGVLDVVPWDEVIDSVALIETVDSGEQVYSDTQVGPDGAFVPGIVFRDPDIFGNFAIGEFTFGVNDTPGEPVEPILGEPVDAAIFDIQGAGHVSPLVGETVRTTGVITAIAETGFFLQDAAGDDDEATSDAIFVESAIASGLVVGNEVEVIGVVEEAVSGGLGVTQLAIPSITVLNETAEVPAPTLIGGAGRVVPNEFVVSPDEFGVDLSDGIPTGAEFVAAGGPINLNLPEFGNANFDPEEDGIDFYESLEGMRVTLNDAVAIQPSAPPGGPGFTFNDDALNVVVDGGAASNSLNDRGGVTIGVGATDIFTADVNPERIEIDFAKALTDLTDFDTTIPLGSSLGDPTGIFSYAGTVYELLLTEPITVTPSNLEPEVSDLQGSDTELSIAAYNVLNLDPNDGGAVGGDDDIADGRFDAIANQIINNLNTPDIVALQEIQDNDGAADEGGATDVFAADETLQLLVDTIAANGGPTYAFLDNPFIADDANGGEGGGNIRTAFLYNPERVGLVEDSLRPATDPVTQQDGISDNNAFENSRIPLAADFTFNDEVVTVVSVHNTAGGIENFGNIQPVVRSGSDARSEQGAELNAFVDDILAANPEANVVVAGDWNGFDYEEWDALTEGTADGGEQVLFNLTDTLPELERYTFQFSNGNLTPLDHIFVTENLVGGAAYDVVHVTAEFPDIPSRASDHDPILATISFDSVVDTDDVLVGDATDDILNGAGGNDTIAGGLGNDAIQGGPGDDILRGDLNLRSPQDGTPGGDDTILGGAGDDRIGGKSGNDSLFGDEGNDTIWGDDGDDLLMGGLGDDTLIGDNFSNGSGSDTFVLAIGEGTDTIVDFEVGTDFIGLADGLTFSGLALTTQADDTLIQAGTETLAVVQGVSAADLTESAFVPV